MKLTYLGTGAAEGVPSLFCQCDNCKQSRALGGRNIRSRSQALINGELLIDFPADTFWHFIKYNFDCEKYMRLYYNPFSLRPFVSRRSGNRETVAFARTSCYQVLCR